ncbi:MAG: LD-carboxypeptidase [Candidatus Nanopelagicales bacterium]
MTGRLVPPGLRPGDRVVVVAPSGPVDPDRLAAGLRMLSEWGYHPEAGPHVLASDPAAPYLAGTEAQRASDLEQAWCDPDVAAVLCARGGYGAGRLVDLLDWDRMAAAGPRLLVGSSDVTALHLAVGRRLGLVSLFAPMVASALVTVDREPASLAHLRAALADPATLQPVGGHHATTVHPGRARGVLAGGTLALLAAAVGTPDTPVLDGCVLLLEDVGESPHRLDRMLEQLERSGALAGVRGIAVGSLHECGPGAEAVLVRRLGALGLPMVVGLDVGHGAVQLSVPLGAEVVLDADRRQLLPT